MDGQISEEFANFARAHLARMTFFMEEDESADPLEVGIFGAESVREDANGTADQVEQAGWLGEEDAGTRRLGDAGRVETVGLGRASISLKLF